MNKKSLNISDTSHISKLLSFDHPVMLCMESTGHFWRSSHICALEVLHLSGDTWQGQGFYPENEEEEYEALSALPSLLENAVTLLTFNGRTFAIPYLSRKCKAYGIACYFDAFDHKDLLKMLKNLTPMLGLPSYHMADFMDFLGRPSDLSQGEALVSLLSILPYRQIFEKKPEEFELVTSGDMPVFKVSSSMPFPRPVSCRDGICHLHFEGDTLSIAMPVEQGTLRLYYADPSEYDYLPSEDYAVHKSLSGFIDPSHKVKATRETCYTRLKYDDSFTKNKRRQMSYLTSLMSYLSIPVLK